MLSLTSLGGEGKKIRLTDTAIVDNFFVFLSGANGSTYSYHGN